MEYGSKDVVLDVVRTERSRFYDVIDDPKTGILTRAAKDGRFAILWVT